jgi:hypothetical protein
MMFLLGNARSPVFVSLEALVTKLVAALEFSIHRVALQLAQKLFAPVAVERDLQEEKLNCQDQRIHSPRRPEESCTCHLQSGYEEQALRKFLDTSSLVCLLKMTIQETARMMMRVQAAYIPLVARPTAALFAQFICLCFLTLVAHLNLVLHKFSHKWHRYEVVLELEMRAFLEGDPGDLQSPKLPPCCT